MHDLAGGRRTRRTSLVSFAVAAVGALMLAGSPGVATPSDQSPAPPPDLVLDDGRPNVVLIVTDDQRRDTLPYMPAVQELLVQRGTSYSSAMVPTSLCCPSRATILTGLYAHSSKVFGNGDVGGPRYGGWRRFHRAGMENRTLAIALQQVGYRTGLVGKYLNFFGKYAPPGYVPPGWDTFTTTMSTHGSYYAYRLNDGTVHGVEPQDYSTDVFAGRAVEFIRSTPVDQPLFLYFAPYAPHAPYIPAPRHDGALSGALSSHVAPTLHQRLSALPRWMQKRLHTSQAKVDRTRQGQLESLLAVDEAVRAIHDTLRETGRQSDTLFIFMSDNGYFWGEHRIIGKDSPYKDSTNIPMVARWDNHIPAAGVDDRLVLNVDIAGTVASVAGATMSTEGLNMFGAQKRRGFVLEAMKGYNNRPAYCGWRTRNRMFVRWDSGERELFDYRLDPHERRNLAHSPQWAGVRRSMQAKAAQACSPRLPHFNS